MNRVKLSNIPLNTFRKFLFEMGCSKIDINKGRGGHEKWIKKGLLRPVILPTHVDPVSEIVVRSCLRILGITRKEMEQWLLSNG